MKVEGVLCHNPLCVALIGVTRRQKRSLRERVSRGHLNVACPFCGTRFALIESMIVERRVMSSFSMRTVVLLNSTFNNHS